MKKIIFTFFVISLSFNARAQGTAIQDTLCSFLKNLKFKNGVDTIEVKATLDDYHRGSDEPVLKILGDEKKLLYSEYTNQKHGSSSLSFRPVNCQESYDATLSRKIYDKTFTRITNNIGAYIKDIVDMDNLKIGQVIYLKCIVFEENRFRDNYGTYFFTIIDIRGR
jgi:hypothetical protein